MSEKTTTRQRGPGKPWPKGTSGNPRGCPTGSRHKATLAAQVLLDGEAEGLTRKCIEMALAGDTMALRLCFERIIPIRRERSLPMLALPELKTARDALDAVASIIQDAAAGQLTSGEAAALVGLIESWRKAYEVEDLEKRVQALEFPELYS